MDYVLPILISAFVAVVFFRRQINAASRKWFEGETTAQKETLADIVSRERKKLTERTALEAAIEEPDEPIPFGYKCAWLAIKTEAPEAVVAALRLSGVKKCNWITGIPAAYKGSLFVTPVVKGWVLAIGLSLPDISERGRPDRLTPLVEWLGEKFDEIQYFGTHRIVGYQAWLRWRSGEIERRFAYLGERDETLRDDGDRTDEEVSLGLIYDDSRTPDEEDVTKLAGAWSIDPTLLDALNLGKGVGYLGSFPK